MQGEATVAVTVVIWEGSDDHETPEQFLTRLARGDEADRRAFARLSELLRLLAERGRDLGPPAVTLRSATASLYDLGSPHGAGQPRLLFFWTGGQVVVLHGFVQRGDDVDAADLRIALSRIYGEAPSMDCLYFAPAFR
jgi:hypothetical protein